MTLFKLSFALPFVALSLLFFGCGKKPIVKVYEAEKIGRIECLGVLVSPFDEQLQKYMLKLYPFSKACNTLLYVVHKERITCNSNQNTGAKALFGMPHNFLRMEIREGMKLIYSYYVDLDEPVGKEELHGAFRRVAVDMKIKERK